MCPTSDSPNSIRQEDGHARLQTTKSMWQIRIAGGNVEEVLGESSDFTALNFNEGTNQELCLQVRCLVTNATSYNVLIR
jgi:hypothetical protein